MTSVSVIELGTTSKELTNVQFDNGHNASFKVINEETNIDNYKDPPE